jgi:hypothetical protein
MGLDAALKQGAVRDISKPQQGPIMKKSSELHNSSF